MIDDSHLERCLRYCAFSGNLRAGFRPTGLLAEKRFVTVPVLIVTGPVGVGKTTLAEAVSEVLRERGVPHGWVDVDGLSRCYPIPPDDPFNARMAVRNVASVWANMRAAGAGRLVLAYVIEDAAGRRAFVDAIPEAEVTIVRLTADPAINAERLRGRDSGDREGLAWSLRRAPELAGIMERNRVGDHVVATDGRTPAELVHEVLDCIGW